MIETQHASSPSLLTRSVENFSTVLGIWHPSRRDRLIHDAVGDALVPTVLVLLIQTLGFRLLQPNASLNISVLQNFAGATALALLALTVVLVLKRNDKIWQVCIGVLWALMAGHILSIAALMVTDAASLVDWMFRRFGLVFLPPFFFLVLRLRWHGLIAFAGLIAPTLLIAVPWLATLGATPSGDAQAYFDPDVEMIYAAQSDLLAEQTARLRPGTSGKVELFAVLGAGYPFEGVFKREVEAVGALLSERFEAENRILSLVNDDADQTSFPLMNRVNLHAALGAVAEAMNAEDFVLLFITSHGAPRVLSTLFDEVITRDISPEDIDNALKKAGIANAVIILPACYSGSFAESLASPNRLILTGADADSISFGCNDKNEWTAWGRAFFVEALAKTRDFRDAARLAQKSVHAREAEEGLPPSSPQILEGAAIGRILDAWLAELR